VSEYDYYRASFLHVEGMQPQGAMKFKVLPKMLKEKYFALMISCRHSIPQTEF